jgi:hypothetical protein
MGEIVCKIWLPLIVLIFIGYLCKYSLFMLPVALLGFIAIQYYFNILTKKRLDDLIKPLKVAYLGLQPGNSEQ